MALEPPRLEKKGVALRLRKKGDHEEYRKQKWSETKPQAGRTERAHERVLRWRERISEKNEFVIYKL